jgi:hypothetical protein
MKKLITLFFVLVAFVTIQAQIIPMTNGDCSTDGALTGASPYIIPGFTITDKTAKLTVANCGISNGSLRIVGPANAAAQGDVVVTTDKVDVSTYGTDQTYSFACTVKSTVGIPTGSINVNITAVNAAGAAVTAATGFVGGAVVKLPNTLTAGVASTISANVKLVPTAGVAKLSFILQVGKFLINDILIDDFTLTYGAVPVVNITPPASLALSTEAGVASAESSFTVDGSALPSDIMVYGGSNLEMSKTSGAGFSQDTIKLAPAGDGSLTSTTIYTRIKAGITSVGTTSTALGPATVKVSVYQKTAGIKTLQFTGTATGFATTLPATDTLSVIAGKAYYKSFRITANSLTADLVVAAGSKLEIATDSLFTSALQSITLPAVGDTVYVRLKKGLAIGNISDETTKVSFTSAGFISKYFQFVGNTMAASAVSNVNVDNLKFITNNGSIKVIGVEAGKQIEIYNSVGQKVKSVTTSENINIPLPYKGIYFIKVDVFVQKLVIK